MQAIEAVFSERRYDKIIQSPIEFFNQVSDPTANISNINFTPSDIQVAIKGVASNAAAGPDQFPAILLKTVPQS